VAGRLRKVNYGRNVSSVQFKSGASVDKLLLTPA
jgi:hypothetical protein